MGRNNTTEILSQENPISTNIFLLDEDDNYILNVKEYNTKTQMATLYYNDEKGVKTDETYEKHLPNSYLTFRKNIRKKS